MHASRFAAFFSLTFLPLGLLAQTKPETAYLPGGDGQKRTFAFVVHSQVLTISGEWRPIFQISRYAHDHTGTYIVFTQDGELRRLDKPESVNEAERMYSPMRELAVKQKVLDALQKPLDKQQDRLGAEQKAATDPSEKEHIGVAQGALGAEQGDIGQLQGAIGRQQGEVGRAFYNRVQAMLSACVVDGTCPRVTTEAAQR